MPAGNDIFRQAAQVALLMVGDQVAPDAVHRAVDLYAGDMQAAAAGFMLVAAGDEHHAVHAVQLQVLQDVILLARRLVAAGADQYVALAPRNVHQPLGDGHGDGYFRHHQPENVAAVGLEVLGGAVHLIMQRLNGFLHPAAGFIADGVIVVQRPGNGGDGYACTACYIHNGTLFHGTDSLCWNGKPFLCPDGCSPSGAC